MSISAFRSKISLAFDRSVTLRSRSVCGWFDGPRDRDLGRPQRVTSIRRARLGALFNRGKARYRPPPQRTIARAAAPIRSSHSGCTPRASRRDPRNRSQLRGSANANLARNPAGNFLALATPRQRDRGDYLAPDQVRALLSSAAQEAERGARGSRRERAIDAFLPSAECRYAVTGLRGETDECNVGIAPTLLLPLDRLTRRSTATRGGVRARILTERQYASAGRLACRLSARP